MPSQSMADTSKVRTLVVGQLVQPKEGSFVLSSTLSSSPTLHDYDLVIIRYSNGSFQQTGTDKWEEWMAFLSAGGFGVICGIDDTIARHQMRISGVAIPPLIPQEGDRIIWREDHVLGTLLSKCGGVTWHAYIKSISESRFEVLGTNGGGYPVALELKVEDGTLALLPSFKDGITLETIRILKKGAEQLRSSKADYAIPIRPHHNQSRTEFDATSLLIVGSLATFFGKRTATMNAKKLAFMFGLSEQSVEKKKKSEIVSIILRRAVSSSRVALVSVVQAMVEVHRVSADDIDKLNNILGGMQLSLREGVVSDTSARIEPEPTSLSRRVPHDYDVAISYAREDEMVAKQLRDAMGEDVRVFLDLASEVDLWGKDLGVWLRQVYGRRTRYVMVLVSQHYAIKDWTDFEFNIAREEARGRKQEFILPVRLDDTILPGLKSTIRYEDFRKEGAQKIGLKMRQKLGLASPASGGLEPSGN